ADVERAVSTVQRRGRTLAEGRRACDDKNGRQHEERDNDSSRHRPTSREFQSRYMGTVTRRCALARSGFAAAFAPGGAYAATTQTSPTLLRLPGRFGLGPSTFGVHRPLGANSPTYFRSSSLNVAVYSSRLQLASTGPRSRSSGVPGLPSVPLLKPRASNCSVRAGIVTPPRRAMPACGTTLMPS